MALTQDQQAFVAALDALYAAFKPALVAALEADNDPATTTLAGALALRDTLDDKYRDLTHALGYPGVPTAYLQLRGSNFLQRNRPGEPPYVAPYSQTMQARLPR